MNDSSPYSVPHEPGRWRALALAVLVHAVLLALLWFGVSWQSETPVAVEAEVWSMQALEAAPKAKPAPVEAKPPPPPEPVRARQPAPAPAEVLEPQVPKAPDIALERERKTKEQQRKRDQEEAARQRDRLAKLEETARKEKQLQQQKLQAQEKLQAQQKTQELQRQVQATEAAAKKKAEDQKKLAAAKAGEKQRNEAALEEQQLAAQREDNLRRMTESASAGSGGSGEAAKSQGARADASYIQKVGAKIKSNTIFNGADELDNNPAVEFAVELLPDGSIRRLRKTKASGVPGFDDAVSRAIEKSQPFPPDKSGSAPSGFTVSHKPKDQ
ncbi:MAG: cell envelope integrity protein TolA [Pseudomonadota bacterium]